MVGAARTRTLPAVLNAVDCRSQLFAVDGLADTGDDRA